MSFLYPHVVAITRPAAQTGAGAQPYGGLSPTTETAVASGLSASIQLATAGKTNPANLPGDVEVSNYKIFSRQIGKGLVHDRDIVTDEQGWRYQVLSAYWDSLGANLYTKRLES
jgi:hypothetical protein